MNVKDDILIVEVYIDDTTFGSTNEVLFKECLNFMQREFQMSMMGEVNFFLRLQVKQMKE